MEAFRLALSAALAEGIATGVPPPAELTDLTLVCRLGGLLPRAMTAADWLGEVDPEGEIADLSEGRPETLIARSRSWPTHHPMTRSWTEGAALYEEVMGSVSGGGDMWRSFWSRVEARRGHWTMTILRSAHVLKAAGSDDWRSFAATGSALLAGQPLFRVPIMGHVFDATSAAWRAQRSRPRTNGNANVPCS